MPFRKETRALPGEDAQERLRSRTTREQNRRYRSEEELPTVGAAHASSH
jgi:hypothetical protein